jgi:hypothetical protein
VRLGFHLVIRKSGGKLQTLIEQGARFCFMPSHLDPTSDTRVCMRRIVGRNSINS